MTYTVGILVASDKGSRGERVDQSGEVIRQMMTVQGYNVVEKMIVPDEFEKLRDAMIEMSDEKKIHLILSTGGTGFSPRDVTPEATLAVIERETPGIPEAMRQASLKITPKAMLSRGRAGIRKRTLIINLPGSPKAVKENLEVALQALKHGLDILNEEASECAVPMES
ncbi:MogA/MoaB family molybdenum cofactor biosynthesis protein [Gottschalkiaceae bacterium SANA]|nr:MogA/MoaB family molybdenum cofactor biosynthesis protein [Gottschalkiaceae bacterium SANA]